MEAEAGSPAHWDRSDDLISYLSLHNAQECLDLQKLTSKPYSLQEQTLTKHLLGLTHHCF